MTQAALSRQATTIGSRDGLNRTRAIAFAILLAVFASVLCGTIIWLEDALMGVIAASLAVLPPLTAMAPILNDGR